MDQRGATNEGSYSDDEDNDKSLRAGTAYMNGINGINLSCLDVEASDNEMLIDNESIHDAVIGEVESGDHMEHVDMTEMNPNDSHNMINDDARAQMTKHKGKQSGDTYIDYKDDEDYGASFGTFGSLMNDDTTLKIRGEMPETYSSAMSTHSPPVAPKPNILNKSDLCPTEDIDEMKDTDETSPLRMYHNTADAGHADLPMTNDLTNLYSHPPRKPPRSPPSTHTYENGPFHRDFLTTKTVDSMNNIIKDNINVGPKAPIGFEAYITDGIGLNEDEQSHSDRQAETTTDNNSTAGGSMSHTGTVRYNGSILLDRDGDNEYPTRCIIKDRSQQRRSIFENEILESFMPCFRRDTARERLWGIVSNEITILCLALIALITSAAKITLTSHQLSKMGLVTVTFLEVIAAISSIALRTAEAWFKMADEKGARDVELVMRMQRQKGKKATWVYSSGTSPELKSWRKKLVAIEAILGSVIILGFVICAVRNSLLVTVLTTNVPLFIGDVLGRMSVYHLNVGLLKIKQDHLKMALMESLYLLQDNVPSIRRKRFINSVKASFYFPAYIDIPRLEQISVGRGFGEQTETSFETVDESAETSLMALA
ncbi:unnamed protein product [Owenia fusiformis]|uniref:Uncharacterized protein n=1 Tax=Owenia fusiformis TaxID=6347 RepID=A0A8J1XQM9_OWEFU|nr:unnamed protein product [Owenia fusiformis]